MIVRGERIASARLVRSVAILAVAAVLAFVVPYHVVRGVGPQLLVGGEQLNYLCSTDHVVLIFDEPLDASSLPAPAAFMLTIDSGVPAPAPDISIAYAGLIGTTLFPTGGTALRVNLPATVTPSSIDLTYDPAGDPHPLRDLGGIDVAPFSNLPMALDLGINNGFLPFIDDGAGPDRILIFTAQPLDPAIPEASDFRVTIDALPPLTPVAVSVRSPGYGMGVLELVLPAPVSAGMSVALSYTEGTPPLRYQSGDFVGSFPDTPVEVSLPPTPSRETPLGNPVVTPPDSSTGARNVEISFTGVTTAGLTTFQSGTVGAPPPSGLSFGTPPTYYEISSTATFASATVCVHYDETSFSPPESALQLLHYEDGSWVNRTTTLDPDANLLCGAVTNHFSPFAAAGRTPPAFSGFFAPVDNPPIVNVVKAGSAVPVKFSLGGNRGLEIFATGSPASRPVVCDSHSPLDAIEQTVNPGNATLSYDASTDRYTYVWKTSKLWTGCRALTVTLFGGASHTAFFNFGG